jgi:hypothetical protein
MTGVTVVLCPALDPGAPDGPRRELAGVLAGWGIPVVIPHMQPREGVEATDERLGVAAWVADQAIAITAAQVEGPLILVSSGEANRAVPALGFSQRASRRSVVAYVLVDGPLPDPSRVGTDWPDAPVVHVTSPDADGGPAAAARLRGWATVEGDPIATVTAIAKGWPDSMP